jgi:hypothetical protein
MNIREHHSLKKEPARVFDAEIECLSIKVGLFATTAIESGRGTRTKITPRSVVRTGLEF